MWTLCREHVEACQSDEGGEMRESESEMREEQRRIVIATHRAIQQVQ